MELVKMSAISQQARKSRRIAAIEQGLNTPLADLLYQMHWEDDLMHREIASKIGIPRPTVTRWFSALGVPSRPAERITKTYLTSWPYKTGQRKPKSRYRGPDRRLQETRGGVNVDFFRKWTPGMAYVLGYFAADGCVAVNPLGARYIHFDSIDWALLETVKKALSARQVISVKQAANGNRQTCYRMQIGSRRMFFDLKRLGFSIRKGHRMRFPKIPTSFLSDFVRGYFDGDGGVTYGAYRRKNRPGKARLIITHFTSSSISFLKMLRRILGERAGMGTGSLILYGTYARLSYSHRDSARLFQFMYGDRVEPKKLLLVRKYAKFLKGLRFCSPGAVV